ncbi:unnamed protein product, partial [marine sediment metagenome]
ESVTAGTYVITESNIPDGWSLANVACTGNSVATTTGANSISVVVSPNEAVECTFDNSASATLKITKDTSAAGFGDKFGFTVSGSSATAFGTSGEFTLDTATPGFVRMTGTESVTAGTYIITEGNTPGWSLANVACTGNSVSATTGANSISVVVSPNEAVECTFDNSASATLKITKDTSAAGFGDKFGFTVSGSSATAFGTSGEFTLDTATPGFVRMTGTESVTAGTYVITESNIPDGWSLANVACTGNSVATTTGANSISVVVSPNEAVECTFDNSASATLKITKDTSAAGFGDKFGFTVSGSSATAFGTSGEFTLDTATPGFVRMTGTESVTAGTYIITE